MGGLYVPGPRGRGDRARIGRCLAALAVNASRAAGREARIGIEAAVEGGGEQAWLHMRVDHLPAITGVEDDLGTALGFGVVRRLVDLLGGDVVVESSIPDETAGALTRVVVRAPVETSPAAA